MTRKAKVKRAEMTGGATDEEQRRLSRLRIVFVMQALQESGFMTSFDKSAKRVVRTEDKTGFFTLGFFTFEELLGATRLSRDALARHLKFLRLKGYVFSKNGVYRLNPEYEGDFKRISPKVVAWLGAQTLGEKRSAVHEFHRFLKPELGEEGYQWYKDEIMRFAREEKRLRRIEL